MNKTIISRDVYNKYQSHLYDERYVKLNTKQFQCFSNNVLMNLNTHPSSLNGPIIWTQLNILNIQKNKASINHQRIKKSIFNLSGITGQKILNRSSCDFYFRAFWILREIMLIPNQIIHCFSQCAKIFLCLKCKFNLMVMNCHNFW